MHWANPLAFLLLLLVPLAFWPWRRWRSTSSRFPGVSARIIGIESLSWLAPILLAALRVTSLGLFVFALARPQTEDRHSHSHTEGVAIQLVIDTSLSMGFMDYSWDNQAISRLDAAKHAIRVFVEGDPENGLQGRTNDLIGLVSFNRYPDVVCPLTHSHETLLQSLEELPLGPYTNIGDGLAWGLERLRKASPKEKVLILLSDGRHNVPEGVDPREAARLAAQLGIRVYTIGAVGNQFERRAEFGAAPPRRANGVVTRPPADSVDENVMRRIADVTGGKYFRATETDGLLAICKEIESLEKSRIEQAPTVRTQEWYLIFLIPGFFVLILEQLLATTRFLMVP